jgi:hypothetical protein
MRSRCAGSRFGDTTVPGVTRGLPLPLDRRDRAAAQLDRSVFVGPEVSPRRLQASHLARSGSARILDLPVTNPLAINLTQDERDLLAHGLREWGGPTRATDLVARAIGFSDVENLYDGAKRIAAALDAEEDLPPGDWARALIATEVAFASDFYGSAGIGRPLPDTTMRRPSIVYAVFSES